MLFYYASEIERLVYYFSQVSYAINVFVSQFPFAASKQNYNFHNHDYYPRCSKYVKRVLSTVFTKGYLTEEVATPRPYKDS